MARKISKRSHGNPDIEGMAKLYVDLRYERDEIAKRMEAVRDSILEAMEQTGEDSTIVGTYSVVVAHPTTAVIDEASLSEELGSRMWSKITTKSLDRNKLDAFIKSGEISPDLVAEHTDVIERNPSLRVTVKKG